MPQPKPPNPDLLIPQSRPRGLSADNLARPCPHCLPQNQFGWRCPRPIPDPESDPDHAWNLDIGKYTDLVYMPSVSSHAFSAVSHDYRSSTWSRLLRRLVSIYFIIGLDDLLLTHFVHNVIVLRYTH